MKRDVEIIRKVLKAIQMKPDSKPTGIEIADANQAVINWHIEMLIEAGYVKGQARRFINNPEYVNVWVNDLTWSGHQLVDALLSDETVWSSVKKKIGMEKLYSMPISTIQAVMTAALSSAAISAIGLK